MQKVSSLTNSLHIHQVQNRCFNILRDLTEPIFRSQKKDEIPGPRSADNRSLKGTAEMAQESQNDQRDESISDIKQPLYNEFEGRYLKVSPNELKSSWQNWWRPSRENVSSHKNELDQVVQNNNSSTSNKLDPRVMSDSKLPSPDYRVHGFYNDELSLEKMLLGTNDHQIKAIGVVGLVVVGKTTLCQKVFNREDVRRHFVPRVWVCMPKIDDDNFEVKTAKRILERLGIEKETINPFDKDPCSLIYILQQQLMGKRCPIVLDEFLEIDGWCTDLNARLSRCEEWGKQLLHKVFPKKYGGRVIVTSRNEESIKKMVEDENLLIELQPLSDPVSCWSIYRDSVQAVKKNFESQTSKELTEILYMGQRGDQKLDEKQIEELKAKLKDQEKAEEELKGKCGGLALAAKLMGMIRAQRMLEQDPN